MLNLSISKEFKNLLNLGEKAFKKLHQNKRYNPNDLKHTQEYKDLINQTSALFANALQDNVVDDKLLEVLQKDVFTFSAIKTNAQLLEAAQLLTADNKIKPFAQFYEDAKKINQAYNKNYLEAEYNFAVGSASVAQRWANFSEDQERYYLQYRTDGGPNVRDSHAALNNTTLPKSDPFWDSYTPQNGWNCHCMVVEVLAKNYTKSNSEKALTQGEKATTQIGKDGKNRLEIFRFNPGKDKVIFPPKHPYTKVVGANVVKKEIEKNEIEKEDVKFKDVIQDLKDKKVKYNEVKVLTKSLKDEDIILKVGGGDLTLGSCASLSLAYAGNKLGLDVTDFRGGESLNYFSRKGNLTQIAEKTSAFVEKDYSDYKAVKKLLPNMKLDNEYILITGGHASIIRKTKEKGFEYLELQSPISNGYKKLTNERLKNRFGCKQTRTSYGQKYPTTSILLDVNNFKGNSFKEMLGFINTNESEQLKGVKGKTK